jgi:hypothetical protein
VVCQFLVLCVGFVLFGRERCYCNGDLRSVLCNARKLPRPKLDDLFDEHGAENVWFQQDGATAHASRRTLGILREMFPGHVVSLRGDFS